MTYYDLFIICFYLTLFITPLAILGVIFEVLLPKSWLESLINKIERLSK